MPIFRLTHLASRVARLALTICAGTLAACGDASRSATTTAASAAPEQPATLRELPLKRGYYVADDTPCERAANATVVLVRRDGISGSRDHCEFRAIEQTGAAVYRVTQACADFQAGGQPAMGIVTYTIRDGIAFSAHSDDGWAYSARYCEQSRMPPEWHGNDISDVTE